MSVSKIIKEYKHNIKKEKKKIVIDVDGVVATLVKGLDYSKSKPIKKNINFINNLKKSGIKIIFFTARGTETGIDWEKTTRKQFKEWGVLYDQLIFGKPAADLYIDDKGAVPSILNALDREIRDNNIKKNDNKNINYC